jgi:FXSXX-COOH protein
MDADPAAGHDASDHPFLIDVTGMPLDQLLPSDDSALAASLRNLVIETSRPQEIISAFGNFAPDDPLPS